MIRVANAPVSYGAFELTVGVLPNVPAAEQVLDAIAAAGYEGTELGPSGYLGEGGVLRERLESRGLDLAGGFLEVQRGDLDEALDILAEFGAKPVLADSGPRDGEADWGEIARAATLARARGLEPTFHPHMGTRVQTPAEIEELLDRTDVGLLLDTGHLAAAGGDPIRGLRDWRERIDHVHVKDVRLDVLNGAANWGEAWRADAFCELGTGDVDLEGFFAELGGYSGWLVVEQDWVPRPGDDPAGQIEAQVRNRRWLSEHAGL
jgi:inosose dehydratase